MFGRIASLRCISVVNFRLPVLLFCVAMGSGCGGGDTKGPVLYPTKGSVTVNGKPAFEAVVTLHPVDKSLNLYPSGEVHEDGDFTLTTRKAGDGAPAGDYKVSINWLVESEVKPVANLPSGPITTMGGGERSETKAAPVDRLGGKFSDPETSGLKCTISKGGNTIGPFDLKLDSNQQ